jgi:hypothetical protein
VITTPEVPSILVGLGPFGARVVERVLRERGAAKDDEALLASIVIPSGIVAGEVADRVLACARELLAHRRMVVARDRRSAEGLTRLHVFVIANLGEPEAGVALGDVLGGIEQRLLGKLGPIFEGFRTGTERNLVVLPLCAMPHPAASEHGEELVRLVRSISARIARTPARQRAVPQLFLIEDVAEFSVLGAGELEQCVRNFLTLLLYSLSAVDRVAALLYGETPEEPLATFVCAAAELPREALGVYARDMVALEVVDAVIERTSAASQDVDLGSGLRDADALEEVELAAFDVPRDADRDVLELLSRYAPSVSRDPEPTWWERSETIRERYGPDPRDASLIEPQPPPEPPVGWSLARMREIESTWRLLQRRRFDDLIAGERERIAADRDRTLSRIHAKVDDALFADPSPEAFAKASTLVRRMERAVALRLEDALRDRDAALPVEPPSFEAFRTAHAAFLDSARARPDLGQMVLWGLLFVAAVTVLSPIALRALADALFVDRTAWYEPLLRDHGWLTALVVSTLGAGLFLGARYRRAHLALRTAFHAMYDALERTVTATRDSVLEYFATRLRLAREVARVEALLAVRSAVLGDIERLTLVDRAARKARSRLLEALREIGVERDERGRVSTARLFGRGLSGRSLSGPSPSGGGDEALIESLLPPESPVFLQSYIPPESRDARVRDVLFTMARDDDYKRRWREEVPFSSVESLRRAALPHAEPAAQWDPLEMPESAQATARALAAFARRQARSLHVALNVSGHEVRDPTGTSSVLEGVLIVPPRAYDEVRRLLAEEGAAGRARIPVHRGVDPDRAFYVLSVGDIHDDAVASLALTEAPLRFEVEDEERAS